MAQTETDVPRIDLIDDNPGIINWALELLGPTQARIFSHASGPEFRSKFSPPRQGCIVMEVRLPGGLSGLDLLAELRQTAEHVPVIFFTGFADVPMAVQAMSAGAFTFLEKSCRPQELWDAVGRALARSGELSAAAIRRNQLADALQSLTPEQRAVLKLAFEGRTNKAIAQTLIISPRTVDLRRKEVLAAFQASSFLELYGSLVELRLFPSPR
jgi:FixJ family two-component response regulator